jgi:hypothetical protein
LQGPRIKGIILLVFKNWIKQESQGLAHQKAIMFSEIEGNGRRFQIKWNAIFHLHTKKKDVTNFV